MFSRVPVLSVSLDRELASVVHSGAGLEEKSKIEFEQIQSLLISQQIELTPRYLLTDNPPPIVEWFVRWCC